MALKIGYNKQKLQEESLFAFLQHTKRDIYLFKCILLNEID